MSVFVTIYTVGHSNHPMEYFMEILKKNDILLLVDVRSIPYSKYNRQFNKKNLSFELEKNGFEYIWMGDLLGGLGEDGTRVCIDEERDKKYRIGVEELIRKAIKKNTVIMCSEENPSNCHRHKIIEEKYLNKLSEEQYKLKINHIRGTGKIETGSAAEQLNLF